jgi:hypothetical protein
MEKIGQGLKMYENEVDSAAYAAALEVYEKARRGPWTRYAAAEGAATRSFFSPAGGMAYRQAVKAARRKFRTEMEAADLKFAASKVAAGMVPKGPPPDERHRILPMSQMAGVYSGSSEHWEDIMFGA